MKTRGLSRFSTMFLALLTGGMGANMGEKPPVQLHSHGSYHRKGKFKGWMRERRRCSFNKNK